MKSTHAGDLTVLYEDNHLLAVYKTPGLLVQGDASGEPSLLDLSKCWIKRRDQKPGNVFMGLVHRLDRPVSGVLVFAKTSKAASRLSEQFRARSVKKIYHAVVEGQVPSDVPLLESHVGWNERLGRAEVTSSEEGKVARLGLRIVKKGSHTTLLEIELLTGRKHQIRAQLSHLGFPVLGDRLYGARSTLDRGRAIGLVAISLEFDHPTRDERISLRLSDALNRSREWIH